MKYKAYITDSNKIFWTKNSVDKPTKQFFESLMGSVEWVDLGNITPNFINQFNGSIVVDKDTYTYLKLINTETNEVKYFSIDRVNKVLNNGFVIDITLDVFTTYTLNFYAQVETFPIKVNRTTAYCLACDSYARLQRDDLITLPQIPKLHQNGREQYFLSFGYKEVSWITNSLVSGYRYKMSSDSEWLLRDRYTETFELVEFNRFDNGKLYSQMIFDVYQDIDGAWFIVPIFGEKHTQFNSVDWWAEFSVNIGSGLNYKCFNYLQFVEKIKNNAFWVNKYKGRFHLPNWMNIIANTGIPVIINTNPDDLNRSYSILMIKIRNGINNFRYQYGPNKMNFNFTTRSTSSFNQLENTKINTYALSKMSQAETPTFFFNDALISNNTYQLLGNNSTLFFDYVNQNNINYNFNETTGISMFTFGYNSLIKLDGTETFPTSTNEYKSYLASVQSSQNTQMQLAKQNGIWGGVKSAISGAMGVASSLATGNVAGAVSSGMGAITGIADSVMQYQNKKREMDAQNADKQRSATAKNIEPSSIESIIKNSTITMNDVPNTRRLNIGVLDGVITSTSYNDFLNEMNSSMINKIVWECGYVVNKIIRLNNIKNTYSLSFFDDMINHFIYWDIEIPNEFIKLNYPNFNNELIEAITTTINNPVRFWKIIPNYGVNLTIGYRKVARTRN